ncbi:MAG: 50S ribosomal protein L25 [Nitrospirae bacterium]|nr:50S ribosomal protein L25 [Nitrospirota bacterium]
MQRIQLAVDRRTESGKGVARSLRRAGRIPAVLYGGGRSILLSLDPMALTKLLHSAAGENTLIELKGGSLQENERLAILRDVQHDPLTGKPLHVDLFEVALDRAIRLKIHVEIIGETPLGVKEGGVVQHGLRELEVECLPSLIPDAVNVDASQLKQGEAIHVRELQLGEGIRVLDDPALVVVSVTTPMSEEKLAELLTATPKETKEPELLAKKEEDAEAGAAPKGEVKAEAKGKEEKKEGKAK